MKCPVDYKNMNLPNVHKWTALPWRSAYVQSSSNQPDNTTVTTTYAMALTILFTVFVFALEHALDERQAKAYKSTKFPEELETTVSKIDAEMQQKDKSSDQKDTDKKGEIDKNMPLLPQLKEKFDKAQSYGTDKIEFGMICSLYNLVESVGFLLAGFLPYVWDKSVDLGQRYFEWDESHEIKITLVFLFIVTMIGTVTGLPFELYSTFRIEKKHGFNKQTLGLFFGDKIKSLFLSCLIGGPFISLLLKIIKWGGDHFYAYVWAFMFVFSAFMMTIVPTVIMPMFNKYEPLPDGTLKTRIYALADRLKYPLTKLFVMDGSKRSSHSNAFMFGFGSNKRIVLYDTLIQQVNEDEILGILGHELGHWKLGHTWQQFIVTQLYFGASFWAFSLCYKAIDLYQAFGFDGVNRPIPTVIALTLFFQTIWAPVDKILSFILTVNSRKNEFAADRFSIALGMSKELQTGLCKISLENLGAMNPDKWYATYHYSHPPLVERLSAMMALEKKSK